MFDPSSLDEAALSLSLSPSLALDDSCSDSELDCAVFLVVSGEDDLLSLSEEDEADLGAIMFVGLFGEHSSVDDGTREEKSSADLRRERQALGLAAVTSEIQCTDPDSTGD